MILNHHHFLQIGLYKDLGVEDWTFEGAFPRNLSE